MQIRGEIRCSERNSKMSVLPTTFLGMGACLPVVSDLLRWQAI
jgi:hypothetical protein